MDLQLLPHADCTEASHATGRTVDLGSSGQHQSDDQFPEYRVRRQHSVQFLFGVALVLLSSGESRADATTIIVIELA